MYCEKCGTGNPDNAKYCRECGALLNSNDQMCYGTETDSDENTDRIERKFSKVIPVMGIAGATIAVLTACGFSLHNSEIKLNDYLVVSEKGYDGYGTVEPEIDWDAVKQKCGKKLSEAELADLEKNVTVTFSQEENLSNEDEISYTWDADDAVIDNIACEISYEDGEYQMSKLEETQSFNPFAQLQVMFVGEEGDGSIYCMYQGTELSNSDFYPADESTNWYNGDPVRVCLSQKSAEELAKETGLVAKDLEMTYTVSGLGSREDTEDTDSDKDTHVSVYVSGHDGYHVAPNESVGVDDSSVSYDFSDSTWIIDLIEQACDHKLTEDDLYGLSFNNCWHLKNGIYAMYGYEFKSQELQAYFANQGWYVPDDAYTYANGNTPPFTSVEDYNIKLVKAYMINIWGSDTK